MSQKLSKFPIFRFGEHEWNFSRRPAIMGILNVTPDSFSDGGRFDHLERAMARAREMIAEGADIIDIGGESTRPGAVEVEVEEEKDRVLPVIQALSSETDIPLSIDTRKAGVAEAAIQSGAAIINDVSGLHHDPGMWKVLQNTQAGAVIMHMRGTPANMRQLTEYQDVTGEIREYFRERLETAARFGLPQERFLLDPGIGFSKRSEHNLQLIARLPELAALSRPLLVGPSRKSFIGQILNREKSEDRLWGTAGAVAAAVVRGAAVIRVHDVAPMRDAAEVAAAIAEYIIL